jgi:hypothetical protein
MTPEAETLVAYLDSQRKHVLGILEGLDEEALRRPVLPSGWSCLALVQHLTLDDERFWFSGTVAGDEAVKDQVEQGYDGWKVDPSVSAEELLEGYRQECARSNEILTTSSLEAPPAWWPEELFGGWRLDNVREVLLHVLTETSVHAGHLDAARELIDGRQWIVLA